MNCNCAIHGRSDKNQQYKFKYLIDLSATLISFHCKDFCKICRLIRQFQSWIKMKILNSFNDMSGHSIYTVDLTICERLDGISNAIDTFVILSLSEKPVCIP